MWTIRPEMMLWLWWHHNRLDQVAHDVTVTIFSRMSVFKGALGTWVEKEYNIKLFFLSVFNSCSGYTMYFIPFSFKLHHVFFWSSLLKALETQTEHNHSHCSHHTFSSDQIFFETKKPTFFSFNWVFDLRISKYCSFQYINSCLTAKILYIVKIKTKARCDIVVK